ncbi:MAG: hypothetical protein CYG59_25065 [Chloroflexi bacterium]|nr:MAG: hypothetical protein CYG59_25065 [Chloroflexota bacterium]
MMAHRLQHRNPQADQAAAVALRQALEAEDICFHTGVDVRAVRRAGDEVQVVLTGSDPAQLCGSHILVAAGTQPNTEDLNVAAAGIELTDKGAIKVDEQLRTSADGIYACGDVATHYQFTHVADYEAKLAVANALQNAGRTVDERVVPWAVYTEPTLAQVGLAEQQARKQGIDYVTAQVPVSEIERSLLVEQPAGLFKAIAERRGGRLLGAAIVSERADDIIHEAALAIQHHLPVQALAATLHAPIRHLPRACSRLQNSLLWRSRQKCSYQPPKELMARHRALQAERHVTGSRLGAVNRTPSAIGMQHIALSSLFQSDAKPRSDHLHVHHAWLWTPQGAIRPFNRLDVYHAKRLRFAAELGGKCLAGNSYGSRGNIFHGAPPAQKKEQAWLHLLPSITD